MDEVDLAESVSHAVKDSRFIAEEKHIALNYSGPESGCKVVGDEVALREIVNNLLSNAVKYTPSKGSIDVQFVEKEGKYFIGVKDTGLGIPKSALPNLFSKFYRVHGGLDSGSTGTGLGLFISKSIAERHQGTITVESEEGKGSVFTFSMPKSTDEDIAAAKQQKQSIDLVIRGHRGWVTQNIDR
jgi:two-component system phosphate regulon sensor histidine kinase PhoR